MSTSSRFRTRRFFALLALCALPLVIASCGGDDGSPADPGGSPGPDDPGVQVPVTPGELTVQAGDAANVIIWEPVSGATSYNLYWSVSDGAEKAAVKIPGATSPYTHAPVMDARTYAYQLTAENSAGESPRSEVFEEVRPGPPLFVSPTAGDDENNDGSRESPLRTLARAYEIAATTGCILINLEAAVYEEVPDFVAGIDLQGGLQLPGWTLVDEHSHFSIGVEPATASGISAPTVISRIAIEATANPDGNSIALYSSDCLSGLRFVECRIDAADAGNGLDGLAGFDADEGFPGEVGGLGSCRESNGLGGLGGYGFYAGGDAGRGGEQNEGLRDGVAGLPGAGPGGGAAGAGGTSGYLDGADGLPGDKGADGANGAYSTERASPLGQITAAGHWAPSDRPGFAYAEWGDYGSGGGGGGGGGGFNCVSVTCLYDDGGGNGGGGGGGGGNGGNPGMSGGGGWGSFAVFLYGSSPTFENCSFRTGYGGHGGDGGDGGDGAPGGPGGMGGNACPDDIGAGGKGGDGGRGGAGAGGLGGPGGPSYGVYKASASSIYSEPVLVDPNFLILGPSAGGRGGFVGNDLGYRTPGGLDGVYGETD